MDVTIVNRQRKRRLDREALACFLRKVATEVSPGPTCSAAVCLVSDRPMRRFNQTYRRRPGTTDVLSFAGDRRPGPDGVRHLGDIVISVPVAAEQARLAGHSLAREVKLLMLHGYLHLLGYDHERDDGAMKRLERRLVRRLLPRRGGR